jgi:hypothetical protein
MFRPTFSLPLPEFVFQEPPAGVYLGTVKRLDVVGSPSPFGSSISQILGEIYRFLVPAGQTINAAFFLVAEGMSFNHVAWCTDVNGEPLGTRAVRGDIWSAVGSPRAAMTSSAPEAAGGEA